MSQQLLYTLTRITRSSNGEQLALVAIARAREGPAGAQFVSSGLGPDFSTQHPLIWTTSPSGTDLPEDVGPNLRPAYTGSTSLGTPASSGDLTAALDAAVSDLDADLHAELIAEISASDGAAALAAANSA